MMLKTTTHVVHVSHVWRQVIYCILPLHVFNNIVSTVVTVWFEVHLFVDRGRAGFGGGWVGGGVRGWRSWLCVGRRGEVGFG